MKPATSQVTALGVLALCFALSVLGRGLGESFTVFLLPISQSFGWDRADVISIYSVAALAGGLAAPVVGRLFDHAGPRIVYALGLVLLGGAFLTAAHAGRLWQLQLSLGLCVGFGIACIGNVPNSILLGRWFGRRLPTAMAVVYSATGAGVLILLPVSQVLIERMGWQGAYRVFGIGALLLLAPLLLLPWKRFASGAAHVVRSAAADLPDEGWTLLGAMRHHAFWALFSTFFFTAIGMFAISAQVVAYLVDAGFPPLQAATAWGFSGVGCVRHAARHLARRHHRAAALGVFSYALTIIGIAMLWLLPRYPNLWLLTGSSSASAHAGIARPADHRHRPEDFRGERVGTIYGTISIGSGLGAASGSWSGGLIHDMTCLRCAAAVRAVAVIPA